MAHRNYLCLPILLLLFPLFSFAREGKSVKGKIFLDDNQPAEFAVVTLLASADSSLVRGAIVDNTGNYSIDNVPTGSYLLTASLTGYSKIWNGPFDINDADIILPDLQLTTSIELQTVTIAEIQPLYVRKPDMLVMNVENSPVRLSGTVYDLIQKIPGVTVNQNGTITMQGRSGVQVYVDGKPTYLSGDQLKQYLENMSAADVSRVEVITNPSSKYDAEGNSGILNIVTKKGTQQGFNGRLRVGAGYGWTPKTLGGFSMNYGMPKANIYARYDYSNWNHVDTVRIIRTVPYNAMTTRFQQVSSNSTTPYSHNATAGVDFNPNDHTSYGFQLSGNFYNGKDLTQNRTDIELEQQDSAFWLSQTNKINEHFNNGRGGIWYKHSFDTTGREISAAADYLHYDNSANGDYETHYYDKSGWEFINPYLQKSTTATNINIYVGQVDYTHPFSKKYKLETGLKSSYVETDNDLKFNVFDGTTYINDTLRTNRFIYTENINAAYAQGYADWGKLQIQVGLRMEQTNAEGKSPTTGQRLARTYTQLFPSLYITQKINDKNTLNLTYTRRINRPDYESLNPFLFYLDQFTYRVGNPFLQPEVTHNMEVTHSFMDFIFTTVGASRTLNAILDVTNQNDSTGTTFQTSANLNTADNVFGNLGFGFPIGKNWMVENNFSASHLSYKSELFGGNLDNQSWLLNAYMQHTISLPKDFKIQVSGWWQNGFTYGIFIIKPQGGVDVGFSKSFLENKLNLSLNFNDIFFTSITRVNIDYQNQNVFLTDRNESRRVMLRLNYNFGNSRAARKSQSKSAADDLKERAGQKQD